jgi:hypothetical protein
MVNIMGTRKALVVGAQGVIGGVLQAPLHASRLGQKGSELWQLLGSRFPPVLGFVFAFAVLLARSLLAHRGIKTDPALSCK